MATAVRTVPTAVRMPAAVPIAAGAVGIATVAVPVGTKAGRTEGTHSCSTSSRGSCAMQRAPTARPDRSRPCRPERSKPVAADPVTPVVTLQIVVRDREHLALLIGPGAVHGREHATLRFTAHFHLLRLPRPRWSDRVRRPQTVAVDLRRSLERAQLVVGDALRHPRMALSHKLLRELPATRQQGIPHPPVPCVLARDVHRERRPGESAQGGRGRVRERLTRLGTVDPLQYEVMMAGALAVDEQDVARRCAGHHALHLCHLRGQRCWSQTEGDQQ